MHHGIDMAGTWQEEVRAPADGFISFSGRNGSFGKAIKINHKHGVSTLYGHLHRLNVKKGQYVKEGQVIGKMGSTGRAVKKDTYITKLKLMVNQLIHIILYLLAENY